MARLPTLCGGFLLAVLWMDLMFDIQVYGQPDGVLPEAILASIAGYYARVTTAAAPMNQLVGGSMLVLIVSVLLQARQLWSEAAPPPLALRLGTLLGGLVPTSLAAARIVPNAVELGTRSGSLAEQSALARSIFYDHVACFALIGLLLGCQLAMRPRRDDGVEA